MPKNITLFMSVYLSALRDVSEIRKRGSVPLDGPWRSGDCYRVNLGRVTVALFVDVALCEYI